MLLREAAGQDEGRRSRLSAVQERTPDVRVLSYLESLADSQSIHQAEWAVRIDKQTNLFHS